MVLCMVGLLQHKHRLLHDFPCFYALQETDNWTISAMDVLGHIVYGRDLGKTAILCFRQVCQFRQSWVSHERCTAILVGAMMILSVHLPHSGFDEEDYFATLEAVRNITDQGKKLGAVDFSSVVTSTLNSSWNLAMKTFRDSMALIGMRFMGRNASEVVRTCSHMKGSCGGYSY